MNRSARASQVGLAILVLFGWLALSSGPASGQCAGPGIRIPEAKAAARGFPIVHAGDTVTLIGHDFFAGCNDVITGPCQKAGQVDPMQGAVIGFARAELDGGKHDLWVQAGRPVQIATVDADEDGWFTLEGVTTPTEPGRYLITAAPPGWRKWIATWLWVK